MLTDILIKIYERDLDKLREEMEQFPDEAEIWKIAEGVTNSAGNLCQHLTGNLQHFIGAVLGNSGYVRDRDAEFATKNASRAELIAEIDRAKEVVSKTLAGLGDEDLEREYPIDVYGFPMSTAYFVTTLTTHFNYHLGQINYLRRLTAGR
jgi:uncharacterized damage-inducible protein DinB